MSGSIPWDELEKQYSSTEGYREELKQMVHSEANAFRAGQYLMIWPADVAKLVEHSTREQGIEDKSLGARLRRENDGKRGIKLWQLYSANLRPEKNVAKIKRS